MMRKGRKTRRRQLQCQEKLGIQSPTKSELSFGVSSLCHPSLPLGPAAFPLYFSVPLLQDPLAHGIPQRLHQQAEEEREAGRPRRTRQETRCHRA